MSILKGELATVRGLHLLMTAATVGTILANGLAGCTATNSGPQRVHVAITDAGFVPPVIEVKRGQPVEVTFSRSTDQTCGTDVVFTTLHRGYDLPLNKKVTVELAAADIGDTLKYSCSMDMLHGMFVAK